MRLGHCVPLASLGALVHAVILRLGSRGLAERRSAKVVLRIPLLLREVWLVTLESPDV